MTVRVQVIGARAAARRPVHRQGLDRRGRAPLPGRAARAPGPGAGGDAGHAARRGVVVGLVEVGDEDAVGAKIECLLYAGSIVVASHAYHRLRTTILDGAQHLGQFLVAHWSVLGVDQQPIVAAMRELFSDRWTVSCQPLTVACELSTAVLCSLQFDAQRRVKLLSLRNRFVRDVNSAGRLRIFAVK